ncbi:S8 family peptidase [Desulfosporosinus fructosivorans]
MSNVNPFPHIYLKLVRDASKKKRPSSPRKVNPITAANKMNRGIHAQTLRTSVGSLRNEWDETVVSRRDEGYPEMPEAIPIFLRIDPSSELIESLKVFGIEIIGELEGGYIIGASASTSLSDLATKIELFANSGQDNVAALWEIVSDKAWRTEHILSPELLTAWPSIRDDDQFVIDVGIACLGILQIPIHPIKRREGYATEDRYNDAVGRWQKKRDEIYEQWDDLSDERFSALTRLVEVYDGEILSSMIEGTKDSASQLPDSFTCRLRLNGKGLRDFVLNFPYLFDVAEVDELEFVYSELAATSEEVLEPLKLEPPDTDAPRVCVIDSGIQERHPLLKDAIEQHDSKSWINTETDVADYVHQGGHGTRVAGAVLYPRDIPDSSTYKQRFWLQNARVLNEDNKMPETLFPPRVLQEIIEHFHKGSARTKVFNHSINATSPCRLVHMSAWAASIDQLTWESDLLFIVSAGNISKYGDVSKPGIREYIVSGRRYPNYLFLPWARIANPGQSLQAVTVGSIAINSVSGIERSFAGFSEPSSFSRSGLGIWDVIKPEVVEYGGDFVYDTGHPPNIKISTENSPQLIRSTLHGGPLVGNDNVGTSFAAPKISNIVAAIQSILPQEPALLYRALLIQSARWPAWTSSYPDKSQVIKHIGYGIPDLNRAISNSKYRITLVTTGEVFIRAGQVHIYEVKIPEDLRSPADAYDIRVEVTLSYKAQPRRTRRTRQRYLSTWLEWQSSKLNEPSEIFAGRMIELANNEHANTENDSAPSTSSGAIQWVIRERSDWGIKGVSRNHGTVQKDWVTIKSHELAEGFCLAVIGHAGWAKDIEAAVPYSLVISFEAVNQDIEIYSRIEIANPVELEVEQTIEVVVPS